MALNHSDSISSVNVLKGLVYSSPMRSPSNPEKLGSLEERKQAYSNRNYAATMVYVFLPQRMPEKACAETLINSSISLFQTFMFSTTRDIERAKQIYVDAITTSTPCLIQFTIELNITDLTEFLQNFKVPMLSIQAVRDYKSPPKIYPITCRLIC